MQKKSVVKTNKDEYHRGVARAVGQENAIVLQALGVRFEVVVIRYYRALHLTSRMMELDSKRRIRMSARLRVQSKSRICRHKALMLHENNEANGLLFEHSRSNG